MVCYFWPAIRSLIYRGTRYGSGCKQLFYFGSFIGSPLPLLWHDKFQYDGTNSSGLWRQAQALEAPAEFDLFGQVLLGLGGYVIFDRIDHPACLYCTALGLVRILEKSPVRCLAVCPIVCSRVKYWCREEGHCESCFRVRCHSSLLFRPLLDLIRFLPHGSTGI